MGDQLVVEGDVRKATSALLGSTIAGSLPHARLALRVKTVLWAVFALLSVYSALVFCDVGHWSTTLKRSPDDILHGWPVDWLLPLFAAAAGIEARKTRRMFISATSLWILAGFAAVVGTTVARFTARDTASLKTNPREHDLITAVWLWSTTVVNLALTVSLALPLEQRLTGFDETTTSCLKLRLSALSQTASIAGVRWSLQTKEMPALPVDSVTVMSMPSTTPTKGGFKPSRSSALYVRIEPWGRRESIDDPRMPMPLGYSPSLQAGSRRASSLDVPIRAPSRLRGSSISDVETVSESEKEYGTDGDGEAEARQEKQAAEDERERAKRTALCARATALSTMREVGDDEALVRDESLLA
ncbi:hypothetical protein JCM10295v2_000415 [Rhodotorula toruloides]